MEASGGADATPGGSKEGSQGGSVLSLVYPTANLAASKPCRVLSASLPCPTANLGASWGHSLEGSSIESIDSPLEEEEEEDSPLALVYPKAANLGWTSIAAAWKHQLEGSGGADATPGTPEGSQEGSQDGTVPLGASSGWSRGAAVSLEVSQKPGLVLEAPSGGGREEEEEEQQQASSASSPSAEEGLPMPLQKSLEPQERDLAPASEMGEEGAPGLSSQKSDFWSDRDFWPTPSPQERDLAPQSEMEEEHGGEGPQATPLPPTLLATASPANEDVEGDERGGDSPELVLLQGDTEIIFAELPLDAFCNDGPYPFFRYPTFPPKP